KRLWAIGGGKGGVGKSVTTVMLGSMLAKLGKKVLLVDADLGGSNLHTFLGIRYPAHTLADFIHRQVEDIDHIIMDTQIKNLTLICGADDILGLANPKYSQKMRIFNQLKKIKADLILLDLGAGTSFTTIDFFLYAPNKIIVLSPIITSLQNAYGFIKSSLYRKISRIFNNDPQCLDLVKRGMDSGEIERIESIDELKSAVRSIGEEQYNKLSECLDEFRINLIVNNIKSGSETKIGRVLQSVANNYLSLAPEYLGHINFDPMLDKHINEMSAFLTNCSSGISGSCIYDIANKVIKQTG
ncbi:MAG TPA: hypothetical protein ENH01_05505, partial [Nitrospirae bacterium]|nr:hypothetical protein [Nitrospirota bacterium]